MQNGAVVSREELFAANSEPESDYDSNPYGNIEFEEVEVEETPRSDHDGPEEEVLEFQLFGNSGPVQIDLHAKPEQIQQSRPDSYYIFNPTEEDKLRFAKAAVSGQFVLDEAQFWANVISSRGYVAPDINAGFTPAKKKCRPGKNARASKRRLHERIEQRRKEEELRWQQMRRNHKFNSQSSGLRIPHFKPPPVAPVAKRSPRVDEPKVGPRADGPKPAPRPRIAHRAGVKSGNAKPKKGDGGKSDLRFEFK